MEPFTIIQIILLLVSLVLSMLMQPKAPKGPSPEQMQDIPTADPSRPVPVLFGTRTFKAPNVIWYGDMKADPKRTEGGKK
jgi:hypothetical protein